MLQKIRVPLGFLLAAAVLYFAEPTAASILVGLPVALVGGVFRALAAGVIKKDTVMTTRGVYALTRNPLYFGSALLACGFVIMSWNVIAAILVLLPFGVIYPAVILRDERQLEVLFTDAFRASRRSVARFFLRFSRASICCFYFGLFL